MAVRYEDFKKVLVCSKTRIKIVHDNSGVDAPTLHGLGKKTNVSAELLIKLYQALHETFFEFSDFVHTFATSII